MQKNLYLGIDIGSVSIKIALIDKKAVLQAEIYTVTKGDPAAVLTSELSTLAAKFPEERIRAAGLDYQSDSLTCASPFNPRKSGRADQNARRLVKRRAGQTSRWAATVESKTGMPNPCASRRTLPRRVTSPRSAPR